jgi:hypothetical protein
LVEKGKATLQELETWWSIDDVADMNDLIDAMAEAEAKVRKAEEAKRRKAR